MNETDKIVAAILAMGFGAIKADRSSVTEVVFVEAYERVLHEMAKREKPEAERGGKGAARRPQSEGR
jgi:hypothetical protein